MANPNQVTLTFAGDSRSLERTFDNVGRGAKDMSRDLDTSEAKVRDFGGAMETAAKKADDAEGKFMGTADVLDGLGGVLGLPLEQMTGFARSFGDLSGGFATLGPSISGFGSKIGAVFGGTGPMALALLAVGGLALGIKTLWEHSETFRDIVTGAFNAVKTVIGPVVDVIGGIIGGLGSIFGGTGDKADEMAERNKEAVEKIKAAFETEMGKVETILDEMADPLERFSHKQEVTLAEVKANLEFNVAEYQKWADDIKVIRDRFGQETAQWVIDQGVNFHGVADELANSKGPMGQDLADLIGQIQDLKTGVSDVATGFKDMGAAAQGVWGMVMRTPDFLGNMFTFPGHKPGPMAWPEGTVLHGSPGGAPITVNVQAWDGKDAGDKVVGAIRTYERSNGTGWRN